MEIVLNGWVTTGGHAGVVAQKCVNWQNYKIMEITHF